MFTVARAFNVTGTLSISSTIITSISDTSRLTVGQAVSGTGIQNGSLINIVNVLASTITLNLPVTVSANASTLTLTDPLFTYSTNTSGQGALSPSTASPFVSAGAPTAKYVLAATDVLQVSNAVSGAPAAAPGEISVLAESPARSGNWQESYVEAGTETTYAFTNVGNTTQTFTFLLPFIVTGAGQPGKLVSRLNVSFNTIVTFEIIDNAGTAYTLSPLSGTVANTGGLLTRELTIPTIAGELWTPGTSAYISVAINAQPGGSAAFAHISLTQENEPYLVFI